MKTDRQLRDDVIAELDWQPMTGAAQLSVVVRDGVVAVSGAVASCAEKNCVHAALSQVEGVKGILMNVRVIPADSSAQTDADLGWIVARVLEWNVVTRTQAIECSVKGGQVTLRGQVEWDYQRQAAERAVSSLAGVTEVVNFIQIQPKVAALSSSAKIEAALRRRADVEPRRMHVDVCAGRVTLAGCVRSCAERDALRAVAWSAPGVCDVVDRLQVVARGTRLKVTRAQHPRSAQPRAAATPVCAQP